MSGVSDHPIGEAPAGPAVPRDVRRRWAVLAVLTVNLLVAFLPNATLIVALPRIGAALGASAAELQWIQAAYSLIFAALILVGGTLAERFGARTTIRWGLQLFLVAAFLGAFGGSAAVIVVARGLMGAAGALLMPGTLAVLVQVFPPGERAKAIAVWASFTGFSGGAGPLLSGLLLEHFWYGSVFLIVVPTIVVALVGGHYLLPPSRRTVGTGADIVGACLSLIGIGLLVYTLIGAPDAGWLSTRTVSLLGVTAAVLIAFVCWEHRSATPMLSLRLFRNARFGVGFSGMFLVFIAYYGALYVGNLWLQVVLDYSPLKAAAAMLPYTVIVLLLTPVAPTIVRRIGLRWSMVSGTGLCAVGFALLSLLSVHSSYLHYGVPLAIYSLGMALLVPATTNAIMSSAPPARSGGAAAMTNVSRELGSALGVAVLGSVAATVYGHRLLATTPGWAIQDPLAAITEARRAGGESSGGDPFAALVRAAFTGGAGAAMLTGAALSLGALTLAALYLRPSPDVARK